MDKELIEHYKRMLKIRYFEEKINHLFSRNLIHGTAHLCIGQEAVAVGACAALDKDDFVTSNHRGHGHAIAKGLNIKKLMMEFQGKSGGYCGGKGGTQHLASSELCFLNNGITAGCIAVATGLAFSFKYKKSKRVVLCFFGDGAVNEGIFHESMNIASLWKLPIIYLCENNLYAMSMPIKEAIAIKDIAERAVAYGIPGEVVDGNNVQSVKEAVKKAVRRARGGNGPTLIECKTYRFTGHSKNDLCVYRTREEEAEWKKKDPIGNLEEDIIKSRLLSRAEIELIKSRIKAEIEESASAAMETTAPSTNEALKNIYSEKK